MDTYMSMVLLGMEEKMKMKEIFHRNDTSEIQSLVAEKFHHQVDIDLLSLKNFTIIADKLEQAFARIESLESKVEKNG